MHTNIKCLLLLARAKVFFIKQKRLFIDTLVLIFWLELMIQQAVSYQQTFSPAISISTLVSWPLASLKKKSNTFSVTEKRIYNHGSKGITTKITHTWILSNDMIIGNYVVLPLNPTQTQPFPMEYNNEKWKMYKAILCLVRHKSEFYSFKEETQ